MHIAIGHLLVVALFNLLFQEILVCHQHLSPVVFLVFFSRIMLVFQIVFQLEFGKLYLLLGLIKLYFLFHLFELKVTGTHGFFMPVDFLLVESLRKSFVMFLILYLNFRIRR